MLTAEGGPGHHKGDAGTRFQVQLAAAGEEVGREVLVRGKPAALPDSQLLRLLAEATLGRTRHEAIGQPGRIADDQVGALVVRREPDRPYQVAGHEPPDVVAALGPKLA